MRHRKRWRLQASRDFIRSKTKCRNRRGHKIISRSTEQRQAGGFLPHIQMVNRTHNAAYKLHCFSFHTLRCVIVKCDVTANRWQVTIYWLKLPRAETHRHHQRRSPSCTWVRLRIFTASGIKPNVSNLWERNGNGGGGRGLKLRFTPGGNRSQITVIHCFFISFG